MADAGSNRVRELREALGLSQVTLAATIGLTRQSVHAIEAGRAIPAVDVALRIARALDCPVESLFGATTADARLTTEAVTEANAGRVALAHIFRPMAVLFARPRGHCSVSRRTSREDQEWKSRSRATASRFRVATKRCHHGVRPSPRTTRR